MFVELVRKQAEPRCPRIHTLPLTGLVPSFQALCVLQNIVLETMPPKLATFSGTTNGHPED